MILGSDLVGMVSSLALLAAPVKDQWYRFRQFRQERRGERGRLKTLRENLAGVWRARRDAYDGWDSLWLLFGALLLLASFALKAAGH